MVWIMVIATSYCLTGAMADGSHTRMGSVANNQYPLGTKITIDPPFLGRRHFVVRDRIGYGSQLDLWAPSCGQSIRFGRHRIRMRKGWV
jgi:3D (Asp-Asp-Asp) domain-containing protein